MTPPDPQPTPAVRLDRALGLAVAAASILVIAVPLLVVRYPPMTDLPFHAAQSAVFAHHGDPSWHFAEQFVRQPFAVPYMALFAVTAALMLVLPAVAATKLAAAVLLALLPAGLAVLLRGMKKSPLLGAFGLLAVWGPLTHMAFLNFVGALGLFAGAVGVTLEAVDRPTTARKVALSALLLAIFFTHVFRFPFAIAGVVGAAVIAGVARRSLRATLASIAPTIVAPIAVFGAWIVVRPRTIQASPGPLSLHLERLRELGCLTGSFRDPGERVALWIAGAALAAYVAIAIVGRARAATPPVAAEDARARRAARLVAMACAIASLLAYLVLPLSVGSWWYVYPREATAAAFLALALLPDLPRAPALRAIGVALALAASVPTTVVVARNYAAFDDQTRDFDALVARLPQAPRLAYLVFDHDGSTRTISPFTHLPAWVQAQKGGWLSFHFDHFGSAPASYRPRAPGDRDVPPPTPDAWEWRPDAFVIDDERGRFFDWFLVRAKESPARVFAADPAVALVDRAGLWWLYRRAEAPAAEAAP